MGAFPILLSMLSLLSLRIWDRLGKFAIEYILSFFASNCHSPVRKIFGSVASIPSALEHEKVFGWGSETRLKKARAVDPVFKTPLFIEQRAATAALLPVMNISLVAQHSCW